MSRLLMALTLGLALALAATACGDDDDDDSDVELDSTTDEEEADDDDATEDADDDDESGDLASSEIEDDSDDLVELLSLVPAADSDVEIPGDAADAIDIQSASLVLEGAEIVLSMTVAGDVGEPADFTRGYDFVFSVPEFAVAGRGVYEGSSLIIGAQRDAGVWSVIKATGPDEPVPLPTATVTVEGSTITIRVPFTEIIVAEAYVWRAVSFHVVSESFTVADAAPSPPEFVTTPLPEVPEGAATPPTAATAEATPTATP